MVKKSNKVAKAAAGKKKHNSMQGLSVRGVRHSYRGRGVLRGVDVHVGRGEVVGLLGPNGAGKSTFFHFIVGLLQDVDAGQVFLDGVDITALPMYKRARQGLGYLPQDSSVFQGLNVEQNIYAVLEMCQEDKHVCKHMLEELLAEFSIEHLRHSKSQILSGGERRRLEMARLLASGPEFVLQDEPLAGIDPIAVKDIHNLILHLKQRNIGVLISDHNVRETLDLVDRAYILHDGQVLVQGTAEEVAASELARKHYLGDDFDLKSRRLDGD